MAAASLMATLLAISSGVLDILEGLGDWVSSDCLFAPDGLIEDISGLVILRR